MVTLEQYEYMFDSMPCGICKVALDEDLTLLYGNRYYYDIYGYTRQSALEEGFVNARYIISESDYPLIHETVLRHVREGHEYFKLEYLGKHRSGKQLWLLVQCSCNPAHPESILCTLMNIADRKQMEDELRMDMEARKVAFELTGKLLFTFEIPKKQLLQPEKYAEEFGLPAVMEQFPYSITQTSVIDPESLDEYIRFYQGMMKGIPSGAATIKKWRKDGTFRWYKGKYALIYDSAHRPAKGIISCEDITEQREKEIIYKKWSQYFKSQEGKTIGYYEYNLSKDKYEEGKGDTPFAFLLPLKSYTQTVSFISENYVWEGNRRQFCSFFGRERLLEYFSDGGREDGIEYLRTRDNGTPYWVRTTIRMVEDPDTGDVKMFMMTIDIDQDKRKELSLRKQVERDCMTGLLNRAAFIQKADEQMGPGNCHMNHALIILDIDHFKEINDQFGHQFGDQVIRDITTTMQSFLRKNDLCGRLGGDEFMILMSNIPPKANILRRVDQLCRLLQKEYPGKCHISCSLGIAFYPIHGTSFQELYCNTDIALYEAKNAGRANYKVYQAQSQL